MSVAVTSCTLKWDAPDDVKVGLVPLPVTSTLTISTSTPDVVIFPVCVMLVTSCSNIAIGICPVDEYPEISTLLLEVMLRCTSVVFTPMSDISDELIAVREVSPSRFPTMVICSNDAPLTSSIYIP